MPSQPDLLASCHPLAVHCKCDEIVPLDAYPPHPQNDNTHPPEQLALFEKILRHQGIRRAAVVSKLTKRFVTGHGMLATLRAMGVTGIPVDYQDFITVEAETDISRYAIGVEWDNTKQGGSNTKFFSLKKAPLDGPCQSVSASGGSISTAGVCHPTEKRKFTIAELRRICGFPDDFILCGSYAQQWERLGNSVPPVMMSHIAAVIRDEILSRQ